jgi:nucleotide-binding universal stress UspA family protein
LLKLGGMTFTHVLCPIDFSEPSQHALAHAVAFARLYGARLTVLHVAPSFELTLAPAVRYEESSRLVYPVSRDEVLEGLHRAAKAAGASASRVEAVAEAGAVVQTILDQTLSREADLIVIGTHGRGWFDRALLGSTAERVIHRAPCPVLTVPPAAPAAASAPVEIAQILCAVDFSPSSLVALGFALDLARQTQGTLTLLHAIEWPVDHEPRGIAHFAVPEYRLYLLADARERLATLVAQEPRIPPDTQQVVVTGRAKSEILQLAARSGTHLIVMGAQGRDGVGLTLFGSTTERVVREATCPVLTVRGEPVRPS